MRDPMSRFSMWPRARDSAIWRLMLHASSSSGAPAPADVRGDEFSDRSADRLHRDPRLRENGRRQTEVCALLVRHPPRQRLHSPDVASGDQEKSGRSTELKAIALIVLTCTRMVFRPASLST